MFTMDAGRPLLLQAGLQPGRPSSPPRSAPCVAMVPVLWIGGPGMHTTAQYSWFIGCGLGFVGLPGAGCRGWAWPRRPRIDEPCLMPHPGHQPEHHGVDDRADRGECPGRRRPGTRVDAVTPAMGPASIESHYDEALGRAGHARRDRAASGRRDGYVMACFGDPGLDAARELASGPVVGIAEAAMHAAALLGRGFSVVTTWTGPAAGPGTWPPGTCAGGRLPRRARLRHPGAGAGDRPGRPQAGGRRCRRHALEPTTRTRSCWAAPGWPTCARRLSAELGVPVIDGVAAATRAGRVAGHGWGCARRTRGEYAPPLPKPYTGAAPRLQDPGRLTSVRLAPGVERCSGRCRSDSAVLSRVAESQKAGDVRRRLDRREVASPASAAKRAGVAGVRTTAYRRWAASRFRCRISPRCTGAPSTRPVVPGARRAVGSISPGRADAEPTWLDGTSRRVRSRAWTASWPAWAFVKALGRPDAGSTAGPSDDRRDPERQFEEGESLPGARGRTA